MVDSDGLGGSAVLTDCVPSKTLIATAELMTDVVGRGRARGQPHRPPRATRRPSASTSTSRRSTPGSCSSPATSPTTSPRRLEKEGVAGRARPRPARRPRHRGRDRADGARAGSSADAVLLATGAAPRTLPDRPAGRRADPHLGAGLRPDRAAEPPDRGRLRRDRRGVRQRLPRPRRRGHPGLQPRPGAPRRGRRRRRRPRGGPAPAAGMQVLAALADGVRDARPATPSRSPSPTATPSRAPTASWRLGSVPQHRRPRPRDAPASPPTRPASSPSTGCPGRRPAASTPPATAPAS